MNKLVLVILAAILLFSQSFRLGKNEKNRLSFDPVGEVSEGTENTFDAVSEGTGNTVDAASEGTENTADAVTSSIGLNDDN